MGTERFAKKSLGQNFLVDRTVIDAITQAVPAETPLLLEIGPGRGALTFQLCERAQTFCVLEKDDILVESIRQELQPVGKGDFVWHGDALEFPYVDIWNRARISHDTPLVVAGNLPYNVATEILLRLLNLAPRISRMVLMFQKEVGQRIAASPNSKAYASLSVLTQNWFETKQLCLVKPGAFRPSPKVDSVVITFTKRPQPLIPATYPERYALLEKILRASFAYRRKTVLNSLNIAYPRGDWPKLLAAAGIDPIRRAETIAPLEFLKLLEAAETNH
jgi:16S rRNA (adenine1518-N6/adenine1519-N6)-dimethyltransferase